MPVTLDNIQFYHGPSKPAKLPHFAFNSNQNGSNTMPSGEQPAFSDEPLCSPADDSTIAPTCFLAPAADAEDTTHQHAFGSPNLFDFELARSCGPSALLLSDRDARLPLQELDCHRQDSSDQKMPGDVPSSFGINSSKSTELDDSGFFPKSNPICASPLSLPQSPSIAVLSPDSATAALEMVQSHVVEDVQQRQNQPSCRPESEFFSPAHTWDTPDASTAFGEHSSDTPLSSISSYSDVASKDADDQSSCISSPVDCPDDCLDDYKGTSQTRLIADCSPGTLPESGPSGPANPLHVNLPDLMDLKNTTRCASSGSHLRTPSVQSDKNPGLAVPGECEKRERPISLAGKQDTAHKGCRSSVAVVIPPPRPRPVRNVRSKPKPGLSDMYESESSDGFDDSSDEDFTSDAIQSEVSDVEDSLQKQHGLPSTAASCQHHGTSFDSPTSYLESRDIVGRAILTIETQGSEPTFFFTLVPDNVRSTTRVPSQSPPRNSEKKGRILKRPSTKSRSTRGEGKCRTYSTHENQLLVKLKEERKLTWEEIADHFPGRTSSALQVHYSTKLRHRRAKRSRPQSRRGKKK